MSKNVSNIFKVENTKGNPFITMTGYIGGWRVNSEVLFNAIKKMEKDGVTDCDILINSGGGSTIEGLTIGEFLEASSIKFHGIVTGMAASMAGSILQFCDTRASYKYGRIMTHKVKGHVSGTADQVRSYADLIEQEEEKIVSKFEERTGKDNKTVLSWMVAGVDKWFNATNAKANNLIDTIINAKFTPKVSENATEEEMVNTYGAVFNSIVEEYKGEETPPTTNTEQNPREIHMKTRILAMLGTATIANGLTENSTDEAVLAELQKVVTAANNETKAVNELKAFKEGQAKILVAAMAKAGKIGPDEVAKWEADATDNYTLVATAAERMVGKVDPANGLQPKPKNPSNEGQPEILNGREDWDHDKWMKEDPKGYEKLHNEHEDAYNKIFNAKFNPAN